MSIKVNVCCFCFGNLKSSSFARPLKRMSHFMHFLVLYVVYSRAPNIVDNITIRIFFEQIYNSKLSKIGKGFEIFQVYCGVSAKRSFIICFFLCMKALDTIERHTLTYFYVFFEKNLTFRTRMGPFIKKNSQVTYALV